MTDDFDDIDDYLVQRSKMEEPRPKDEEENPKMKEQTQQMDSFTKMMKGKDDSLDFDEFVMTGKDKLPNRFKMPDLNKFDSTGDPKMHLKQYAITMGTTGLNKTQIVKLFVLSLQGAAMSWYHDQEKWVREDWKALSEQFIKQYGYNTRLDVTLRDLEMTWQKSNESFLEYIARWRAKAAKMRNQPIERDQVRMVMKGARPLISSKMQYTVLKTFEDLLEVGLLEEVGAENERSYIDELKEYEEHEDEETEEDEEDEDQASVWEI